MNASVPGARDADAAPVETARTSGERPSALRHWLAGAAVITALTLLAYIPAMRAGYIWDDGQYLVHNPLVRSWDGLQRIWLTTQTPQYYPLVFTSFWIEYHLWELQPAGYHVVNIVLHILNAILVWRIARRLAIPGAWAIGAVFAVHPVHVESVAWITERKNVLSGLFYLLALYAYLRFDRTGKLRHYAGALVSFIAALLSKSVAAMLAPVLPLVIWYRHRKLTVNHMLAIAPLLLIGIWLGLHTANLEREKVGAEGIEFTQTFAQRVLIIAPSAYLFYAEKVLWPYPVMFNYPRWDLNSGHWTLYLPLVVVMLAFGLAIAAWRRIGPGPLLLMLFSAITLFPALGFVNVYPHRFSFVADHFQYLGSLGYIALFVSLAVWAGRRWIATGARRSAGVAVTAAVLAAFAIQSFASSRSYESSTRLWEDTLAKNPHSWMAMVNLSNQYRLEGRHEEAIALARKAVDYPLFAAEAYFNWAESAVALGNVDEAIELHRRSLEANPEFLSAAKNLGNLLMQTERLDEAADVLTRALGSQAAQRAARHSPRLNALLWFNLAGVRERQGQPAEFEACIQRAIEFDPQEPEYRRAYGEFLFRHGRYADAVPRLREAVTAPGATPETSLALIVALMDTGQDADAIRACNAALQSGKADVRHLERAVWLLATSPDPAVYNAAEAARLGAQLQKALGETIPPPVTSTLAAVSAATGDFSEALRLTEQGLEWAQQIGDEQRISLYRDQLAAYRGGKTYRRTAR